MNAAHAGDGPQRGRCGGEEAIDGKAGLLAVYDRPPMASEDSSRGKAGPR